MIEASIVQSLNAIGHQQVAVGDHSSHTSVVADAGNDQIQVRMQQRFATANHNQRSAQPVQMINTIQHHTGFDWGGKIVVFVAVAASQITAANGDQVGLHNVVSIG